MGYRDNYLPPASRALLRSQSGPVAGMWLAAVPAGFGLASAARVAPAACWAAWADVLPVMAARLPAFAAACVATLQQGGAGAACMSHTAVDRGLGRVPQLDRSCRGPAAGRGRFKASGLGFRASGLGF